MNEPRGNKISKSSHTNCKRLSLAVIKLLNRVNDLGTKVMTYNRYHLDLEIWGSIHLE